MNEPKVEEMILELLTTQDRLEALEAVAAAQQELIEMLVDQLEQHDLRLQAMEAGAAEKLDYIRERLGTKVKLALGGE